MLLVRADTKTTEIIEGSGSDEELAEKLEFALPLIKAGTEKKAG